MTITTTVEELREYQAAMQKWVTRHNTEVLRILPSTMDHMTGTMRDSGFAWMATEMNKWIAANPMPKLIPPA